MIIKSHLAPDLALQIFFLRPVITGSVDKLKPHYQIWLKSCSSAHVCSDLDLKTKTSRPEEICVEPEAPESKSKIIHDGAQLPFHIPFTQRYLTSHVLVLIDVPYLPVSRQLVNDYIKAS